MGITRNSLIQEATAELLNLLDIQPIESTEEENIADYDEEDYEAYSDCYEEDYTSANDPYGLSQAVGDDPEVLATAYMNLGWD